MRNGVKSNCLLPREARSGVWNIVAVIGMVQVEQ